MIIHYLVLLPKFTMIYIDVSSLLRKTTVEKKTSIDLYLLLIFFRAVRWSLRAMSSWVRPKKDMAMALVSSKKTKG